MSDINSCIHDIRNKMAHLQSFQEKMIEKLDSHEVSSYEKCLEQIGDLLDCVYLLANGKSSVCVYKVGVKELNLALLESLRDLNTLYPKVIFNYDFDCIEAVLDFSIDFDKYLFFQVLDNLACNSIRAQATIIEYTLNVGDKGLHIVIRDNGLGNEYHACDSLGMIPHGQGLEIVQRNMNKMKGSISLISTDEDGFLANLYFPRIP